MSVKKIKSWKDVFIDPESWEVPHSVNEAESEWYGVEEGSVGRYVPPQLEAVSDAERHREGYFYFDEVTPENAAEVRFLTSREFVWEEFFGDLFPTFRPWECPGYPMPKLEVVVGGVFYGKDSVPESVSALRKVSGKLDVDQGSVAVFPSLVSVHEINSGHGEGASLSCPVLTSVGYRFNCVGSVFCDSLVEAGSVEIFSREEGSRASFASLRSCGSLSVHCHDISFPSLEKVRGQLGFHRYGPVEFPSLRDVGGFVCSGGPGRLSMPVLEEVGGLILGGDGLHVVLDFPVLHTVGNMESKLAIGGVDLRSGMLSAPSLKRMRGDFEFCHGASADVPALEVVGGDLFLNCGPEVWFAGGRSEQHDGYGRKPVVLEGKSEFFLPSLKMVGRDVQAFDGTVLKAPKLSSVGGEVCVGKDVTVSAARKLPVGYSIVCRPDSNSKNVLVRFKKLGPKLSL